MTTTHISSHNGNWLSLLSATFACFIIVTGEFLAISVLNNIAYDFQISTGTAGLQSLSHLSGMASSLFVPIYAKISITPSFTFLSCSMILANAITAFASI
ncbi:MFS transporter [Providencia rettgeri]|uniref:MFS transporter n=1 Tax=Providencia rettgeri TaxID=587 RepID=A0A939NCX5_PRORE|nr:MFS transporter [Providencia rettgeri]